MTGSPTIPQTARLGLHTVNRTGFGAMQLAGPGVFGPPADPAAARAVLRRAIELGVEHIDTAQFYGPGVVNELIRDALHPYPAGLRIVSKVGARRDGGGGVRPATRPDELRAGVEANLQTLRVDALALVNLRLTGRGAREGGIALAEQLGALHDAPRRGQDRIDRAQQRKRRRGRRRARDRSTSVQVQNAYNIKLRDDEDVLRFCADRDIAYVPFVPLGSSLTGGPRLLAEDPTISSVAAKHAATPAQVALAWLLHKDHHVLLIPGTSSLAHLEQNMAAAAHRARRRRPVRTGPRVGITGIR